MTCQMAGLIFTYMARLKFLKVTAGLDDLPDGWAYFHLHCEAKILKGHSGAG